MAIGFNGIHYGGIIMNYVCSSRCAHCLYASAPQRDKAYLTAPVGEKLLDALADQRCMDVHIGGGEPFLQPEELIRFCKQLQARGFTVDYVETNSSWAVEEEKTKAILRRLLAAGVDTLLLSISPYHLEYVPMEKVERLMKCCRATGMGIFLWRREFWDELAAMGPGTHTRQEMERKYGADYWQTFARRYGVGLGGRARETYHADRPHYPAEKVETQPCRELFNVGHFHMDCYGMYIPSSCTGLGIAVEDLRALPQGKYPLIEALHEGGVAALHALAKAEYGFTADPAGYINGCHLCSHIREFLALDAHAACPELHPADYYRQLRSER